jgi:hypothetical protein
MAGRESLANPDTSVFLDYLPMNRLGLTEEQVERYVERATNGLDRLLMGRHLTQADYDTNIRRLDLWAEDALKHRTRAA